MSKRTSHLEHADRRFDFGDEIKPEDDKTKVNGDKEELLEFVRDQIIGEGKEFQGPFGCRKISYCDFTASGKSLKYIEDYIQQQVLPFYANTHTTTSITGRQSTFFRHEARELIKHALHGTEDDVLLFTGTGATGAVHKLIGSFGLDQVSPEDIVVFVGPHEHHSNLLPWRELKATIINIPENTTGALDIKYLEKQLQHHLHFRIRIGAFSAASNVTGLLADQNAITACLHRYEALAFWDFAAAGPYVSVDMNPVIEGPDRHLVYKDAIFLSPHKFVGGPNTPGLLIAKRKLFQRPTPKECGGGTVFFVSREDHRYLSSIEEREEGGTPDIIGSIRCGLIFQLKSQLTPEFIHQREIQMVKQARESLQGSKILLLGPESLPQIPIFSFLIQHEESGLYLHHNFVCAILNDVYGIQVRGGCVCAGPYAQELLGIDFETSKKFEEALLDLSAHDEKLEGLLPRERDRQGAGNELLRPGFVRMNFHYTMDSETFSFVLSALKQIAEYGWKLLPLYKFNTDTGEWIHRSWSVQNDRKWLGSLQYFNSEGRAGFFIPERQHQIRRATQSVSSEPLPSEKNDYFTFCLSKATEIYANPRSFLTSNPSESETLLFNDSAYHQLRWFLLPYEAFEFLKGNGTNRRAPFSVKRYAIPVDVVNQKQERMTKEPRETKKTSSGVSEEDGNSILFDEFSLGDDDEENDSEGFKFHVPSKKILHSGLSAIDEFNMIQDGDRVIACISGGKDSLSMLHLLKHHQYMQRAKGIHFELAAATVDPLTHSTYDPRPLKIYMEGLGIPYFYLTDPIMERARNAEECKSICSYCSRMKRGMLYSCARREGYNVLALGQHLDDLAESFMMSFLHNGLLRTMKANYTNQEGDLRIIRPLVNTRERDLAKFAAEKKLPVIPENCPACFEAPKERHRLKQLLAAQENLHKNVFQSIKLAIKPLANISQTGQESGTAGEAWIDSNAPTEDPTILDL